MLAALGFTIFIHIDRPCQTINALDFVGRLKISLLNLQLHKASCQRYHTDIVPRIGLNSHHIALFQVKIIDVMIICLARILELNLH